MDMDRECGSYPAWHGQSAPAAPDAHDHAAPGTEAAATQPVTKVIGFGLSSDELRNIWKASSPYGMNPCTQDQPRIVAGSSIYALELPMTFERGAGVTRAMSRHEVQFVTRAGLREGQLLTGVIRFPAEAGATGSVLHYTARVTCVLPPAGVDDPCEVTATFEQLAFALGDLA